MDIASFLLTGLLGVLTMFLLYVAYLSKGYGLFKKMGIKHVKPWPGLGSLQWLLKKGFLEYHKEMYFHFKDEKVYGFYELNRPMMVVRDLDMLKGVMVKNFNNFVDRRVHFTQKPTTHGLTGLKGEQWRHVRNAVSPTYSPWKLKKTCLIVEESARSLTSNLRRAIKDNRAVELNHVFGCFTLDVIASSGYGMNIDSLNDENCQFVREAKKLFAIESSKVFFVFFFPGLLKYLDKVGFGLFPRKSLDYFNSFLDAAMKTRNEDNEDENLPQKHDLVHVLMAEMKKQNHTVEYTEDGIAVPGDYKEERTGLTLLEAQGQTFSFLFAAYVTVSATLGFALFTLAHETEVRKKIQKELDEVLGANPPDFDSVQNLVYLEMCIHETLRLYPPAFIVDRMCTEECEVEGVKIPKGMTVTLPILALHLDPEYFPDPYKFDPERFTAEKKAARNPFTFLPFGQGPRNCIGVRLATIQMKIALAYVLREMNPIPCSKTVYPPKLSKYEVNAVDGMWVKLVPREEVSAK